MLLCPLRCICQMLQPHNVFSGPVSNIFPFSTEPLLRLLLCFCYTNSLYRGPQSRELTPKPMPLSLIVNDHEFCPHARQILHLLTHLCIIYSLATLQAKVQQRRKNKDHWQCIYGSYGIKCHIRTGKPSGIFFTSGLVFLYMECIQTLV